MAAAYGLRSKDIMERNKAASKIAVRVLKDTGYSLHPPAYVIRGLTKLYEDSQVPQNKTMLHSIKLRFSSSNPDERDAVVGLIHVKSRGKPVIHFFDGHKSIGKALAAAFQQDAAYTFKPSVKRIP